MPLPFYETLMLVPAFANPKKPTEDFHFYEKRRKTKIVFSACFAGALIKTECTQAARMALPRSFSATTLSISVSNCQSCALCLRASVL